MHNNLLSYFVRIVLIHSDFMGSQPDVTPLFTTLGLFIIDDNVYPESWNRETEYNIIGGGASYAIVGSRFVAGPKQAKGIYGIIDKGSDFPKEVEEEIMSWGTGTIFRQDNTRLTTRGANIYRDDGVREFVYRSTKKRIEAKDVISTGLIHLSCFHFCCSVERCEESIDIFNNLNADSGIAPTYVFEPFPEVCVAENFAQLSEMLRKVTVFTPNLNEAAGFAGLRNLPQTEAEIRTLARLFFQYMSGGCVVLRCGELGSYVCSENVDIMLPAYHQDQSKVVDVTGAGNTFCGAYITALKLSNSDYVYAGVMATLASGCAIECLGVPKLENEKWNGLTVKERLQHYIKENALILEDSEVWASLLP